MVEMPVALAERRTTPEELSRVVRETLQATKLKDGLQAGRRNLSRRLDPGTCEVHVERPCFCAHPSRFEGGVHRVDYARCVLLGRKGEYEKGPKCLHSGPVIYFL
jgi:hypothetical protein